MALSHAKGPIISFFFLTGLLPGCRMLSFRITVAIPVSGYSTLQLSTVLVLLIWTILMVLISHVSSVDQILYQESSDLSCPTVAPHSTVHGPSSPPVGYPASIVSLNSARPASILLS